MSELSYSASKAREQARAYVASILKALGSREAMEVLAETPATLRRGIIVVEVSMEFANRHNGVVHGRDSARLSST